MTTATNHSPIDLPKRHQNSLLTLDLESGTGTPVFNQSSLEDPRKLFQITPKA